MPISENQLIIPDLIAMYNSTENCIQTTDLINEISDQFDLDNHDLLPLVNRNDEKFTQIIRNLKSHKTLHKLNYALEIEGGFQLTQNGIDFLEINGFV